MITSASTLFRYISRQFIINFCFLMLILLGLMLLLDVVELMRRASFQDHVSMGAIISMSLLKLPSLGQQVLPMGILFTSIYTCWKLNKTNELVVIRSFGISVWQFLSPLVACAVALGVLSTTVINPISSIFLGKYEQMENYYFNSNKDLVTVSKTGIWLRQPSEEGYALLHSATFDKDEWQLKKVIVLFFDRNDTFLRRMDSPEAYLKDGYWEIRQPIINDKKGIQRLDIKKIPTELTSQKIEESFADPETISFWSIPEYISIMEETGFPATRLYIHFHSLLARPFLLAAMVLLAATFSLRPQRFGGVGYTIVLGVAIGFLIFFVESILQAFGISQKIPVYLAAWTPSIIGLLLGGTALLHTEDG